MTNIKNVLIICSGNTARSPAAKYLAKFYANKKNLNINFSSAGFFNAFTYMQPESRAFLDKKNIDHSDFSPQTINRDLLEKQDLIITMERSHKTQISNNYSNIDRISEKIYTLKEFNGEMTSLDIEDPYYTSNSRYKEILKIIDENVEKMIQKIKENAY
ncbi:MAG: hypothetical protein ACQERB_09160 [Promethearchaeati archaeon]